jgi:hypothetical protein
MLARRHECTDPKCWEVEAEKRLREWDRDAAQPKPERRGAVEYLSEGRDEWQSLRTRGGQGRSIDSYFLSDWRQRNKPVDALPSNDLRIGLEATREWFETDQSAEPRKPLDAFNHPEHFRAGTEWLEVVKKADPVRFADAAAKHGSLVGETKGSSLDSEARARGESLDSFTADDEGATRYPAQDAAGLAAHRRQLDDPHARRELRHVEAVTLLDYGYAFDMSAARDALRRGVSERAFAKQFGVTLRQSRQYREALADLLGWDLDAQNGSPRAK